MSSPGHAVITAAGIGSRLGMNMPKCLVSVAGRCIIDYQLELLRDVEDVRIVVGFQRDRVIQHVRHIRSDVIFVCNHRYASTTVLESLFLGVQGLREPFLVLDGDVIPDKRSFDVFLQRCGDGVPLTAICRAASSDPVYADVILGTQGAGAMVCGLLRDPPTIWEWPGISFLKPAMIENRSTYVYQQVQKFLPMPTLEVECCEIDTPQDLERAEEAIRHA